MRQQFEDILDQALTKLSRGTPKEEILSTWPEHAAELEGMLDTVLALSALPKKDAPKPDMQRKYLLSRTKQGWLAWLRVSKLASASMSVILLVSALAGTGYAASQSMPGETLFGLKKTAEKLRIRMVSDPETKVVLQMEITKKRLSEAEQVFKNPARSPKQEIAALTELNEETQNTIEAVNSAAKSDRAPQKSDTVMTSLNDIAKQQQNLLNEIKPTEVAAADTAKIIQTTQENATKVAEIKRYLEVASNEQALATLGSKPEIVMATGTVSVLMADRITIEKTTFYITEQTSIKNTEDNTIKLSDINVNAKVNIVGVKENDKVIAQQINLIYKGLIKEAGEARSASTTAAGSASTTPSNGNTIDETAPVPASDPNTAVGSFILEDPAPQAGF